MVYKGDARSYDVVLTGSHERAKQWNRERALASRGGAFGQVAQTFDAWVEKLWEQQGDGRVIASCAQELMAAQAVVASHAFEHVTRSPGLPQAIAQLARSGLGVPGFDEALRSAQGAFDARAGVGAYESAARQGGASSGDAGGSHADRPRGQSGGLTAAEAEVLLCVGELSELLGRSGLIEQGEALRELALHADDVFLRPVRVLFADRTPMTGQQAAFFAGVARIELHHDPDVQPPSLGKADVTDVRLAFPSGRYAQAQLLLDMIDDLLPKLHGGGVVISSADPLALYEKIALGLAEKGVSCAVQGQMRFADTDFGRAYLSALAAREPGAFWDKAALTDVLHSSFVNMSKASVWNWDKRLRGDRIIAQEQVFAELRESPGAPGNDVASSTDSAAPSVPPPFALMGELAHGGRPADEEIAGRFRAMAAQGASPAYVQEQRLAYYALCDLMAEAKRVGSEDARAFASLLETARFSCVKVAWANDGSADAAGAAAGSMPRVRIMDQRRASQLPAGSAAALFACDLTTESYPLKEPTAAAALLLRRLGAGPRDTALAQARRAFTSLVRVPRQVLVLERCLNDAGADPYYPSAMLEEFMSAYRDDGACADPGTLKLAEKLGVPSTLLAKGPYLRGEEDYLRDVRPATAVSTMQERVLPYPLRERADGSSSDAAPLLRYGEAGVPRLSASQLESYLDCPYKWFVQNRCHADDIDEELGPREAGSFLHEVFQTFYPRFGEKVTASNLGRARELMFGADGQPGVFDEVVAAQYARGGNGRAKNARMVVLAGTSEEYEVDYLRFRVGRWLDFETTFLPGFTPVAFECEIDGALYGGCEISGTIDRIDVDEAGRAVVIDYKGSLADVHRALKGNGFTPDGKVQALVYARILKQAGAIVLEGEDPSSQKSHVAVEACASTEGAPCRAVPVADVVGALYVSYNKGNAVSGAFDAASIGLSDIPTLGNAKACELMPDGVLSFDAALDNAARRVGDAVSGMVSGDVAPRPAGKRACAYCPVVACEERLS